MAVFFIFVSPGINVYLKYPYSREIDEKHIYTEVQHHAVTNMSTVAYSDSDSLTSESESSLDNAAPQIYPVSDITYCIVIIMHSKWQYIFYK